MASVSSPRRPSPGGRAAPAKQKGGFRYYLKRLGPGLVTGAANDDPGAIGTHAQVGAQFGAAGFWLAPYTLPLTAVVLEMCALQVLNGLVAIPLVFLIVHICNAASIMGENTNGRLANTLGWTTFGLIVLVGAASIWTLVR